VVDPRVKHVLKQGRGRMGAVATPGWDLMCAAMPFLAHPGYKGARAFAKCRRQGAIARAGRGGGKSTAMLGRFHSVSAAHPNSSSVFVAMSSERARDILAPAVMMFNEKWNTGITERRYDGAFLWPNGFRVLYRGLKDKNDANKRRGVPWVSAGWDECDSLNQELFQYDIHDCVEPRLIDFNGLWFAGGTPGPIPKGYWYDLSSGDEHTYPLFCWDARHNQHMPNVLKFFSETLMRMKAVPARHRWPSHAESILDLINDPSCWKLLPNTFVREYLGQWVLDLNALVYKITARNSFREFPITPSYVTIGVDLGAHSIERPDLDHAAVAVACSHISLPNVWVREVHKLSDCTVDSIAAFVLQLLKRYPTAAVHMDSASAGKLIEITFNKMGIPIQAAQKAWKLRRIQLVQSRIRSGDFQLHVTDCMDARKEAVSLVWNEKRDGHSERCDDDAWDAILYAAGPHFGNEQPVSPPVEVSPNAAAEQAEFEEILREASRQNDDEDDSGQWDRAPLIWTPDEAWPMAA
jgi:hypothetical protein